jgi:hypothetical protein
VRIVFLAAGLLLAAGVFARNPRLAMWLILSGALILAFTFLMRRPD